MPFLNAPTIAIKFFSLSSLDNMVWNQEKFPIEFFGNGGEILGRMFTVWTKIDGIEELEFPLVTAMTFL